MQTPVKAMPNQQDKLFIRPLFINTQDIPVAQAPGIRFNQTPMHKRKGSTWSLIKSCYGKTTYDMTPVKEHADKVIEQVEKRLMKWTMAVDPEYKVIPSTIAYAGDALTPLRASLLMEISYFIQSYAKKNWYYVGVHSALINTKWLEYHRAVFARVDDTHVDYRDAENIHSAYNFIPVKERTLFSRRKKQVSK